MRKALIVVAAMAMALTVLAPMAGAAPADYRGVWTTVDLSDGSNLTMTIAARRPQHLANVYIHDDSSPYCGGGAAEANGSGDPSGTNMTVHLTLRCVGASAPFGTAYVTFFAYQNTLTDSVHAGSVWYR